MVSDPDKLTFMKSCQVGPVHLKDEMSFWDELFRPQDIFSDKSDNYVYVCVFFLREFVNELRRI